MKSSTLSFAYIRPIELADYYDQVYPELCKQNPPFYGRYTKRDIYEDFKDLKSYGVFVPDGGQFIGLFWRNPADNEVHVLIFEAWRGKWPLRQACKQLLDIWFGECGEIYARITDRHPEARKFFELLGAKRGAYFRVEADVGFSLDYYYYSMTAAMRRI